MRSGTASGNSIGPVASTSAGRKSLDQRPFYDDLVEYYDLIYADWEDSMRRHAAAISAMLGRAASPSSRILDVSSGIGTQALPLAAMGYEVVARDLSPKSIARLEREARARGVSIDAAVADMRDVGRSVVGSFDAIIAFDNSVPHLLSDAEIIATFRGWSRLLAPAGRILVSVRDYGAVSREPRSFHSYGERVRGDRRFRMGQEWAWLSESHYQTTMVVEELIQGTWTDIIRTHAVYYAVPIDRLLSLMGEADLTADRVTDVTFFQPVLTAGAR